MARDTNIIAMDWEYLKKEDTQISYLQALFYYTFLLNMLIDSIHNYSSI